jgi:hypothetical protein
LAEVIRASIGTHSQTLATSNVLVERCAPRHARVVDEDVDLALLGFDRVDEVVASSLGL